MNFEPHAVSVLVFEYCPSITPRIDSVCKAH